MVRCNGTAGLLLWPQLGVAGAMDQGVRFGPCGNRSVGLRNKAASEETTKGNRNRCQLELVHGLFEIDSVPLCHSIEGPAVYPKYFCGSGPASGNRLENIDKVTPLELIERRQVFEHGVYAAGPLRRPGMSSDLFREV